MLRLSTHHSKTLSRFLKPCLATYISMVARSYPLKFTSGEQSSLSEERGISLVNTGSVRYAFSTNQDSTMAFTEYGDVSGKWYNELGSQMEIFQSADGGLKGVFVNSAPGSTDKDAESLIGSLGKGVPATLGFVVNFEDGKYTTSWSGQYRNDEGKEVLKTTWLMTANLQDGSHYWESANVGQDFFTREPQNPGGRKSFIAKHLK